MARRNTKYAIYVLAGIVLLSLVIYPFFQTTGKQVVMAPVQDTSCSDNYYPMDCEAAGCTWSSEYGCTDGSDGGTLPPLDTQPPEIMPSTCIGLSFWKCITTEDCNWDWETMMCIYSPIQYNYNDPCKNGVLDYGETDIDCGGDKCLRCGVGKTCGDNYDCDSEFCDFQLYLNNQKIPTFKCLACDSSTADDNIQNCGETGIDCGGGFTTYPCSCYNGVRNQGESLVDCNLPISQNPVCATCINNKAPHCTDGALNKGEVCIDCGGSCSNIKPSAVVPSCCKTPLDCEISGNTWCYESRDCKSQSDAEDIPYCWGTKEECEAYDYFWCGTNPNANLCLDKADSCLCWTDKTKCEADSCFWCDQMWINGRCYIPDDIDCFCFTNDTACEEGGCIWSNSTCIK